MLIQSGTNTYSEQSHQLEKRPKNKETETDLLHRILAMILFLLVAHPFLNIWGQYATGVPACLAWMRAVWGHFWFSSKPSKSCMCIAGKVCICQGSFAWLLGPAREGPETGPFFWQSLLMFACFHLGPESKDHKLSWRWGCSRTSALLESFEAAYA